MEDPAHAEPQSKTAQLLAKVRAGDSDSWKQLDDYTRQALETVLDGRIPQNARAQLETEDLLQSTYLRAHSQLESFEYQGPGSFQAWLTTILLNRLKSRLRRARAQRRDVGREQPLSAGQEPLELSTPIELFARAEGQARLLSAISRLPERENRVVRMRLLQQRTQADVAQELGLSPATISRTLVSALESIHRWLK